MAKYIDINEITLGYLPFPKSKKYSNFNDSTLEDGIYLGLTTATNGPADSTIQNFGGCPLIHINYELLKIQILYIASNNSLYSRFYFNGQWNAWSKYAKTSF